MSVAISKVTRHFQITLPKYMREIAGIHEGDLVSFEFKNKKLTVTPIGPISKDQAYYWTAESQKEIALAMEEYKKGLGKRYKNVKEAKRDFYRA